MKKIFFLLLLISTGCKKETVQPECNRLHTGSYKATNTNTFPIKVLRDGVTICTLESFTTGEAVTGITIGVHTFHAISTTLPVPVEWSGSYEVKECVELNVEYK